MPRIPSKSGRALLQILSLRNQATLPPRKLLILRSQQKRGHFLGDLGIVSNFPLVGLLQQHLIQLRIQAYHGPMGGAGARQGWSMRAS